MAANLLFIQAMTQIQFLLTTWFRLFLCLCLAVSPFYGVSVPAQTPAPSESELSQATTLMLDVEGLLDRAIYPNIPRLVISGAPTQAEVAQIETRLQTLHTSYRSSLAEKIAKTTQPKDEVNLVIELNTYFSAAQKLESLKIILRQGTKPETWEATYGLKFQLDPMSQLTFLAVTATMSENYVTLPGSILPFEELDALKNIDSGFKSHLENSQGKWLLSLSLNPAFAEKAEQAAMIENPNTRNVLLYALHWSAHRMYESRALTQILLRQPMTSLPEPSQAFRDQFASLRVRRAEILLSDRRRIFAEQKPQVLKAILDSVDAANKQNKGWMLDVDFIKEAKKLGLNINLAKIPKGLDGIRDDERKAFQLALVSLLNLVDLSDWYGQTQFLLNESKRLALRWSFLANPDAAFRLPAPAQQKLAQLIDQKATAVTAQILSDGTLNQQIYKAAQEHSTNALSENQRIIFQTNLQKVAHKFTDFETQTINLQYLMGAQRNAINNLHPSAFVAMLLEAIEAQKSYQAGYEKYQMQIFTYLQAFTFSEKLASPIQLSELFKNVGNAQWNPQALAGAIDGKYIAALVNAKEARTKDLNDLVQIGQLLKFDRYEKVRPVTHELSGETPTPQNMKLGDSRFTYFLGSEKRAYLEEMKKDLFTSAPILGAALNDEKGNIPSGELLWEYLNRPEVDSTSKFQIVDSQLLKVVQQIAQNNASLDQELQKVNGSGQDGLNGVGKELQTLVTRASQISVGLNSFAGFSEYYSEIRQQLLLPGFAGREWNEFTTWTARNSIYLMGFYFLQLFARVSKVGMVTDSLATFFAPIFGPNFKYLNRFIMAMVGIGVADAGVKGFFTEAWRKDTLEKFFSCGSAGPCVALYSDVSLQRSITDAERSRFTNSVVMLAALSLGFAAIGMTIKKISTALATQRRTDLLSRLEILGLDETSPLTRDALNEATRRALAKARLIGDPVESELAQLYIREALAQIESLAWKDSAKWFALDQRFAKAAERLGLNTRERNWKDLSALNEVNSQLEARYQAGEISSWDYREMKQAIMSMYQILQPVYAQMSAGILNRNYMDRVWNNLWLNPTTAASKSQISATQAFLKSQNLADFQGKMDRFYTGDLSRLASENGTLQSRPVQTPVTPAVDRLLSRLALEISKNPGGARSRIEAILSSFRKVEEK